MQSLMIYGVGKTEARDIPCDKNGNPPRDQIVFIQPPLVRAERTAPDDYSPVQIRKLRLNFHYLKIGDHEYLPVYWPENWSDGWGIDEVRKYFYLSKEDIRDTSDDYYSNTIPLVGDQGDGLVVQWSETPEASDSQERQVLERGPRKNSSRNGADASRS